MWVRICLKKQDSVTLKFPGIWYDKKDRNGIRGKEKEDL